MKESVVALGNYASAWRDLKLRFAVSALSTAFWVFCIAIPLATWTDYYVRFIIVSLIWLAILRWTGNFRCPRCSQRFFTNQHDDKKHCAGCGLKIWSKS